MTYYLVFDVETSGLEPDYHEIIQLGAALYDEKWNKMTTFLTNVYANHPDRFAIPASRVHEISIYDLKDAPMMHEVIENFEAWLLKNLDRRNPNNKTVLRDVMLCGQSISTDINFLRFAYRQNQIEWNFSYKSLDLFVLSQYYFRLLKFNNINTPRSLSLGAVAEYFGLERENDAHNALEDAILTAECVKRIWKNAAKFQVEEDELGE